jgi:hypothetical protein
VHSRLNGLSIQTRMKIVNIYAMQSLLEAFRYSYNTDRLHQLMQGAKPVMVWYWQLEEARLKLKTKVRAMKAAATSGTRVRRSRAPALERIQSART